MNLLSKAFSGRRARAQKIVIYAPEGFGKSCLAGKFPDPFFLDVEDSATQLEVRGLGHEHMPDLKTFESALAEIAETKPCATLVVDTIDWLETLAQAQVVVDAKNPKIECIEDFGYGKGWVALKDRLTVTFAKFDRVIAAGVHVVLLAHSKVAKFEPPDGAGAYDRYEMKLSKHVAPLVKEWSDALLFGNWRVQVSEKGKGENVKYKGVGGRERLMFCNRSAAWDAKNRHGLNDVEKWDIETILRVLSASAPTQNLEAGRVTPAKTEPKLTSDVAATQPVTGEIPAPPSGATHEAQNGSASPPLSPVQELKKAEAPDEIPGIAHPARGEDADLARICEPNTAAVNEYLWKNKRIKPTEDWHAMPADFRARVLKNPAGFLKVVATGNGVTA